MVRYNTRKPRYIDDSDYTTNTPSYYDDLARKQKLIKELALRIWEYDKTLAESLENIENVLDNYINIVDGKIEMIDHKIGEGFNDEINNLLVQWVNDGTLNHIINEEIFNTKVDTDVFNDSMHSVNTQLAQTKEDLNGRGINLKSLGAVLDGVVDDFEIVRNALDIYNHVVIPDGAILGTTQTIFIREGQTLIGANPTLRGYKNTPTIKYIGGLDRKKSVVILGKNNVGAEPTGDASNCQFRNVFVDANNLAGFGVYGTYLVNETVVDNVSAQNSLEYNMYFARGWYATLTNLVSLHCKGKGIALGMPLEYQDGTKVDWVISSPLELNNIKVDNIRSIHAGRHYSVDNPGLYDPTKPIHSRQGYGIGAGIGNGFRLNNLISESSGGTNLYVYTGPQPSKTITNGYLEAGNRNSGLDPATTMANIIIEHTSGEGGSYEVSNIFMNYNSGGIYHIGAERKVWLKNVQQPRFLKSLSNLSVHDLYSVVLKENVSADCGQYNTLQSISQGTSGYGTHNTRYSFEMNCLPYQGAQLVYVKGDGTEPWGSYDITSEDGTVRNVSFPSDINEEDFVFSTSSNIGIVKITKAGRTGETHNSEVTFKVVNQKHTYY